MVPSLLYLIFKYKGIKLIPKYDQAHASYAVATLRLDRWQKILNLKGDFRKAKEGVRGGSQRKV